MGGGHIHNSWETDHPDSSQGVYSYLITLKMNTIEINCGEKIVVDSRNYVTLCCVVCHVCIQRPKCYLKARLKHAITVILRSLFFLFLRTSS